MLKPQKDYAKTDMARGERLSEYDKWEDDFDRAKKRKSNKKESNYKRKSKYKNNHFDDEY